jgi:hypothetical protein
MCKYVWAYHRGAQSSAYNMRLLYPRLRMLCLSCCKTLGPMLLWCSVIVAAVGLPGRSRSTGFLRAGRGQPRTELIGTAEFEQAGSIREVRLSCSGYITYCGGLRCREVHYAPSPDDRKSHG